MLLKSCNMFYCQHSDKHYYSLINSAINKADSVTSLLSSGCIPQTAPFWYRLKLRKPFTQEVRSTIDMSSLRCGHCDSALSICFVWSPQSEHTSIIRSCSAGKPTAAALSPTERYSHPVHFNRCPINTAQVWVQLSHFHHKSSVCLGPLPSVCKKHFHSHISSDLPYKTINLRGFIQLVLILVALLSDHISNLVT